MRMPTLLSVAGAAALTATLAFGGSAAIAQTKHAQDPSGDVTRAEGVAKKATSDVNRFSLAVQKQRVELRFRFDDFRKGTANVAIGALETGSYKNGAFAVTMLPDDFRGLNGLRGDGVYWIGQGASAAKKLKGCDLRVAEDFGKNGELVLSLDRECLRPKQSSPRTVRTLTAAEVAVGKFTKNGSTKWMDGSAEPITASV